MLLWSDYEGKIIAGNYPLEKLLRPEGRSAFFTTFNGTGTAAVVRLIESLNDEQEILARWRTVTEIKQPHLLTMKTCGEDVIDGTPLIYAILESTDANLADVLRERPLTVQETLQVATSLVPALQALHARNLAHEHVEANNVLAAGEVIKLRSDCVRDMPASGFEAYQAKARDVHDFAALLLHARTLQQQTTVVDLALFPAPLAEIVRNGLSGAWGLGEISAALNLPARSAPPVIAPVAKVAAQPIPVVARAQAARSTVAKHRRAGVWIAAAIVVLLAVVFLMRSLQTNSPARAATSATLPASQPKFATVVKPPASPTAAKTLSAKQPVVEAKNQADWRVIAYTYNHTEQAQSKAAEITAAHPTFKPEVFTPHGSAHFLVTLGGTMTRSEATALRQEARTAGLAGDMYIQNYSVKSR